MSDMEEARARMIAKRFGGKAGGAATGGGGSVRRKHKAAHKTSGGKTCVLTLSHFSSVYFPHCPLCVM
jgi:hypothetical protein